MKKLFLLLSLSLLSFTACFIFKPDFFSGVWQSVEENNNQPSSIVLIITKMDSLYDVEFVNNVSKERATKKYILSDDGKTLKPLDNNFFEFKKEGKMLYTKHIGYFKK